MQFRTVLPSQKSDFLLDPRFPVIAIGSCFADNIASRMRNCLWNATNPMGTLYNPLSIASAIKLAVSKEDNNEIINKSIVSDGQFSHSWLFDSSFSGRNPQECEGKIKAAATILKDTLGKAQALIVTFGTAWCYYLESDSDYLVANCHKFPASCFSRRRLRTEEITEEWRHLIDSLKISFPDLRIIFTVSPVRHIKDGLHENTLSKATLHIAIEELCRSFEQCSYFPAYELLCDDLRDYRFYASDLVHPSAEGIEYIWEYFKNTYLDRDGEALLKEGENIRKGLEHRPLLASDEEIREFRLKQIQRYEDLRRRWPHLLPLKNQNK